eukprot:jgi/Chrpa1/17897/Chrysochromulina_OHIO_Genome00021654-RA
MSSDTVITKTDDVAITIEPHSLLGHLRAGTSHLRAPWMERIPWYPKNKRPYTRRELASDALVHGFGICMTGVAMGHLYLRLSAMGSRSPPLLNAALGVYLLSLLGMFVCSSLYNIGMGHCGQRHFATLACVDHAGICLLIAGTYTPFMLVTCCFHTLSFVWALALFTFLTKLHGGRLDTFALHGWYALASCLFVWSEVVAAFSEAAIHLIWAGGACYTIGLIPWAANKIEGHVCLWHLFVSAGSTCIYFAYVHDLERLPELLRSCPAVL